jgi:hypothetical protein
MKKTAFGILVLFFFLGDPYFGHENSALVAQQEQAQLQHEVKVTLKLVQVYVTDKKGNPVVDLTKDDFLVLMKEKKDADGV